MERNDSHDFRVSFAIDETLSPNSPIPVSPPVWQYLTKEAEEDDVVERISVALRPLQSSSRDHGIPSAFLCWACRSTDLVGEVITIPTLWCDTRADLFKYRNEQLSIAPSQLIEINEVILMAHSETMYRHARDRPQQLCNDCQGLIARYNDRIAINIEQIYKVINVEPVLQGLICEATRIVVVPPNPCENPPASPNLSSDDDLDISEGFLASSLGRSGPKDRKDDIVLSKGSPIHGNPVEANQRDSSVPTSHRADEIIAAPLYAPLYDDELVPRPSPQEDETARVYVRAHELARHGLISGEWVLVTATTSRLLRAFRLPAGFPEDSDKAAFLPAVTFYNISPDQPTVKAAQIRLRLRTWPQHSTVHIPTASLVTVSRICSPISVDRQYQSLCVNSLKSYFEQRRRMLRVGDIVAIGVDLSQVRLLPVNENEETDTGLYVLPPVHTTVAQKELVYFRIADLEMYGPMDTVNNLADTVESLQKGDFGAYIDPNATKMVQSGTVQSLVPARFHQPSHTGDSKASAARGRSHKISIQDELTIVLRSCFDSQASRRGLPTSYLLKSPAPGTGKRTVAHRAAARIGCHLLEIDCYDLVGETDLKTEGHLRARFDKAISCAPCMFLLCHLEALARKSRAIETGQESPMSSILAECIELTQQTWASSSLPVFVIGTTSVAERIPAGVLACFKRVFIVSAPDEMQRRQILRDLTRRDFIGPDADLSALGLHTASLVPDDLVSLVSLARELAAERIRSTSTSLITLQRMMDAGISLTDADFSKALENARTAYSESIGAPKIPNVTWDDVGGLAHVKAEILETIQLPLERPDLFAEGMKKRSGILLYGPPGTGKTLLAKAVATSCSLNFFSVKGPELLNMYIGESEANVRRVFQRARDAKPCVVFFDELDSVAPKRGNQGDSGGVMDRIVSQLLAELDGMSGGDGGADVFVIGATNRPDLLDPALLRPGRFDRMLYLGVSETHDGQRRILQALTRKFRLASDVDLNAVAQICPLNLTGADFYALCSDAMLKAMSRKAAQVEEKIEIINGQRRDAQETNFLITPQYYLAEMASPEDVEILVSQQDFMVALQELVPSVSVAEMDQYVQKSTVEFPTKGFFSYAQIQQRFSKPPEDATNGTEQTSGTNGTDPPPSLQQQKSKIKEKGKGRMG